MNNNSIVFNTIKACFTLFLIFLISFVWLRYFVKSFSLAFFLSILLTFFIYCCILLVKKKKEAKLQLSAKDKKNIEGYNNALIFSDDKFVLEYFYELASKKHKATKKNLFIIIENENSKVVLFPYYIYRGFSSDDLVYILNTLKNVACNKIIVCTNTIEIEVKKIAERISSNIVILDKEETYFSLMKQYEVYPSKFLELAEKNKFTFEDFLAFALCKKRTKAYFISSVFLLLSSFVVRYNIYYTIMSSFLLVLSLISFINPKFNKKTQPINLLDA